MSHASHHRSPLLLLLTCTLCLSAAVAIGCGAASAADAPSPTASAQPARWVRKEIRFTYQGFTTHYSCEGLLGQVRTVLLQLGARPGDMKVSSFGCVRGLGRPEPNPSVRGTFYVLEPLTEQESGRAGAEAVAAHWQTVNVRLSRSLVDEAGQCELLEQVKERILPLFSVRNVKFSSNCMPHQLTIPGAVLQAQALKPDRPSHAKAGTAD